MLCYRLPALGIESLSIVIWGACVEDVARFLVEFQLFRVVVYLFIGCVGFALFLLREHRDMRRQDLDAFARNLASLRQRSVLSRALASSSLVIQQTASAIYRLYKTGKPLAPCFQNLQVAFAENLLHAQQRQYLLGSCCARSFILVAGLSGARFWMQAPSDNLDHLCTMLGAAALCLYFYTMVRIVPESWLLCSQSARSEFLRFRSRSEAANKVGRDNWLVYDLNVRNQLQKQRLERAVGLLPFTDLALLGLVTLLTLACPLLNVVGLINI